LTGISVSGNGDVNNDGFADVIIGAREADPNGLDKAGAAYVVFGKAAFDPTINLSDLNTLDGSNGFVINGEAAGDLLGESLSSAGDVNGDGFQDIIVGALGANGYTGTSYVIFGSAQPFSANFDLSQLDRGY
jgi:hypothetical protein